MIPWHIPLIPLNCHPVHLFYCQTTWIDQREVVWIALRRLGPRQASRVAPAPWVRPHPSWATLSPISLINLLWSSRVTLWRFDANWSWFDLDLVLCLHLVGPWFGLVVGLVPLGSCVLCNMVLRFVSLCILNVFSMYSINVLLQMVKHQNLWKLLVLKPYF
jgi:hypothetical protein